LREFIRAFSVNGAQRFLAACACKPVDRTPVWMMRQAGRYLPEYREVREKVDFLTLCKTPDLAVDVSLQPIKRFGMDACIVFSDILVPVEAMGAPLTFTDQGPVIIDPVRSPADVERLYTFDPAERTPFVLQTLRTLRSLLRDETALIGFCGGPFTLASYLIEGGGSKNFAAVKALLYARPEMLHALLAKLAESIAGFAAAQVSAGAQAVQVFDTWAGELSPAAYRDVALPYQKIVIERIKATGVPAILFVNGCAGVLERLPASGADVFSVDWRIGLEEVRRRLGAEVALQGNVDPAILLSTPQAAREAARDAMRAAGPCGHILNLGHGVLPGTPIECARAFIDAPKNG
jgi:uroporphyrinogen decarboxylase